MVNLLVIFNGVLIAVIGWLAKEQLGDIKKRMEKLTDTVAGMGIRLTKVEMKLFPETANPGSPLSLTDRGKKLLKESGLEEYIGQNKEELLKYFDGIDNPLDIQTRAKDVMVEKIRENKRARDYTYNEGINELEIEIAAGIALRDVVLEHKKIDTGSTADSRQ